MTNDRLIAASDPHGLRQLAMARLGDGYIFASGRRCLDAVGATYVRDVEPGGYCSCWMIKVFVRNGSRRLQRRAMCAMEFIYFSRPDSDVGWYQPPHVAARDGL